MKIRRRNLIVLSTSGALILLSLFVTWICAGYAQERGKGAGSEAIAQLYASAKKEGTRHYLGADGRDHLSKNASSPG